MAPFTSRRPMTMKMHKDPEWKHCATENIRQACHHARAASISTWMHDQHPKWYGDVMMIAGPAHGLKPETKHPLPLFDVEEPS